MIDFEEFNQWTEMLMHYKFALDEMKTKLDILDQEYKLVHSKNPIEHIKSRIKKPASIVRKLQQMDISPTVENASEHVLDIAGIRVVCSFIDDIYYLSEVLQRQDDLETIQIKDYIKNPKASGYRSLHLIVKVPIFLSNRTVFVPVEIQVRTTAMDTWASLEHKLYYKNAGVDVTAVMAKQLKDYALIANTLDLQMQKLKNEIELIKGGQENEII